VWYISVLISFSLGLSTLLGFSAFNFGFSKSTLLGFSISTMVLPWLFYLELVDAGVAGQLLEVQALQEGVQSRFSTFTFSLSMFKFGFSTFTLLRLSVSKCSARPGCGSRGGP
jgi:hypothetical protein